MSDILTIGTVLRFFALGLTRDLTQGLISPNTASKIGEGIPNYPPLKKEGEPPRDVFTSEPMPQEVPLWLIQNGRGGKTGHPYLRSAPPIGDPIEVRGRRPSPKFKMGAKGDLGEPGYLKRERHRVVSTRLLMIVSRMGGGTMLKGGEINERLGEIRYFIFKEDSDVMAPMGSDEEYLRYLGLEFSSFKEGGWIKRFFGKEEARWKKALAAMRIVGRLFRYLAKASDLLERGYEERRGMRIDIMSHLSRLGEEGLYSILKKDGPELFEELKRRGLVGREIQKEVPPAKEAQETASPKEAGQTTSQTISQREDDDSKARARLSIEEAILLLISSAAAAPAKDDKEIVLDMPLAGLMRALYHQLQLEGRDRIRVAVLKGTRSADADYTLRCIDALFAGRDDVVVSLAEPDIKKVLGIKGHPLASEYISNKRLLLTTSTKMLGHGEYDIVIIDGTGKDLLGANNDIVEASRLLREGGYLIIESDLPDLYTNPLERDVASWVKVGEVEPADLDILYSRRAVTPFPKGGFSIFKRRQK